MANLILEAVQTALKDGEATVNLNETGSALTGSGSGVGGRVIYDDAFASLRQNNPIRNAGARIITTIGSDEAFVAKTGNITNVQQGSTYNPWGYPINNNNAHGATGIATTYWQIPVRDLNAVVPVRTAVMGDINNINESIVGDIMLEFAQQEALSMMLNNDQAGSTTYNYGATLGLRGLNSYAGSTSAASFGSNGSAITNGLHTVLQVAQGSAGAVTYNDLANLYAALPSQYLADTTTCWMMHPTTIKNLRELVTTTSGVPYFIEVGDDDGGAVIYIFGKCVIPNPYMQVAGAGNYPVYFAAWSQFVTIADNELMSIKAFEQTNPGFITLFCEKRVVSTIRDVFAGVRLYHS
jgi:HK97 family phage major capsid protein